MGADGIAVRRWGRSRFVAYEDIERVEHGGLWLAVALRGGGSVRLGSAAGPYALAIAQRIEAARAAWKTSAQAPARVEDLDRGGRPLEAWRGALRRLVMDTGYRAAAWSPPLGGPRRAGGAARRAAAPRARLPVNFSLWDPRRDF